MPKVGEAYLNARRNEIVDAALISFALKGFREATIEDIAREAGLSHGAIYRYFPSKEDIVEAVARREHGARARRFIPANPNDGAAETIRHILHTYVRMHAKPEHKDEGRLRLEIFSAAVRNRKVMAALRNAWKDVIDRFTELVRRGQKEGTINPALDAASVARVIAALHDGIYVHQTIDPSLNAASLLEVVDALIEGTFRVDGGERRG